MWIASVAVISALLLMLHHIYIHPEYKFPDRAFQVSDVSNHETWIVALLALAIGTTLCAQ